MVGKIRLVVFNFVAFTTRRRLTPRRSLCWGCDMSELKKTEITVVQSAEPSLGKVAENENFIKDRKKLMDAILIASTEAENKAYHEKLLDMNPQDYAELSNVK